MNSEKRVFCAGFGGQGVMMMGQLISYAGMMDGKEVTWCPAYGPEMRGGTANCSVVVSGEAIAAPIVSSNADVAVVMNKPSLEKFERVVKPGGTLFINSSLIDIKSGRSDINTVYIPVNDIAAKLGMPKMANIIMLGAILEESGVVDASMVEKAVIKLFGAKKPEAVEKNRIALAKGAELIKERAVKKAS